MPTNLEALRDIHLPANAGWWPLAYGYWILLGLLVVAGVMWWRRYRRYTVRRAAQRALHEMAAEYEVHKDPHELARQVNVLLRRSVLSLRPRDEVGGLTGKKWIEQVHSCVKKSDFAFSDSIQTLLIESVYQATTSVDANELLKQCRLWVNQLPPSVRP